MRTTEEEFKVFKDEFIKWQKKLGLQGYDIVFRHEKDIKNYATITVHQDGGCADVVFTTTVMKKDKNYNPKNHAKHEALHLLVHKLYYLGRQRFVNERELYHEWEKLVVILEKVL